MEDLILFNFSDGREQYVHKDKIDAFMQTYPDAIQIGELPGIKERPGDTEPGRDLDPEREKSFIPSKTTRVSTKGNPIMGPGTRLQSETLNSKGPVYDQYSIRNIPIEYEDGETRYISTGEVNDLSVNIPLANKIKKIKEYWKNYSFEPITEEVTIPGGHGGMGRTLVSTVMPHEKELDALSIKLTELKEKGALDVFFTKQLNEDLAWEGITPPPEIVKEYFRHEAERNEINKTLVTEKENAYNTLSEDVRNATIDYNDKRIISANGKELEQDWNNLTLKGDTFSESDETKIVHNFEDNVLNPKHTYEIPDMVETVTLFNGKVVPMSLLKEYTNALSIYNRNKEDLKNEYLSITSRYETIKDANEEIALLKRDYGMLSKLGWQLDSVGGGFFLGGMEYLEAGVNYLRDLEHISMPGGGFTILHKSMVGKEVTGNEFTFFEEWGKKRRQVIAAEQQGGTLFFNEAGEIVPFNNWDPETGEKKEYRGFRSDVEFSGKLFTEFFSNPENLGRFLFEESGRQLPIFAIIAASGGTAGLLGATATASIATAGTVIGVMTAGQQIGDMTHEEYMSKLDNFDFNDKEHSELSKFWVGTGFGTIEGTLGVGPTAWLQMRFLKNGFGLMAKHGYDDLMKVTGMQYFKKNIGKEIGIGILAEAPSEGLTQGLQNWITGRPFMEGVGHATFSGGFFGGILSLGGVTIGAMGRAMMDQNQYIAIENDIANRNKLEQELMSKINEGKGLDGRSKKKIKEIRSDIVKILKEMKDLTAGIQKKIDVFENTWSNKMGPNAFEAYKKALEKQAELKVDALKWEASDFSDDIKKLEIDKLAVKHLQMQQQIDKFKDPAFYANKFQLEKINNPENYNKIIKKAKNILEKEGKELTDSNINKTANDIWLKQQMDIRARATNKVLRELAVDTDRYTFQTEGDAKKQAAKMLKDEGLTADQRKFWTNVLDKEGKISEGGLNGYSQRVDDRYSYLVIKDNAINNERSGTETHEVGHITFWSELLQGVSADWDGMATAIMEYLEVNQPGMYEEMFGLLHQQRVEVTVTYSGTIDGTDIVNKSEEELTDAGYTKEQIKTLTTNIKFNSMEVVMGFLERAGEIKFDKKSDKAFLNFFGNFARNKIGTELVELGTTDNIVDFIITLGKKLGDGTLTKQDLINARKNKMLDKYKLDKKEVDETGKSESTLFETTELIGKNWENKSDGDKLLAAQQLALYWEHQLAKKIGQQIVADETEQLALLNKFTGFSHNTKLSPITESYSAKRGFINIVMRWDPKKNDSLAAWIQSARNLPMRILSLAKTSKVFGRFEDSVDKNVEGKRPTDIPVVDSYDLDAKVENENEFRKLLNIDKKHTLYNTTLDTTEDIFLNLKDSKTGKTVRQLLKTDPRRARTVIKEAATKALRADVTKIIGSQKSQTFKDFIRDEIKLQKVIDLLAVKYRSSFPFLSDWGGNMDVGTSKANIESDKGSFVSDTEAGNDIWIPKNLSKMSPKQKADFIDFVEKAFVDGLVTKKYAKDGTIEYNDRETVHKALKDAFANELVLDATFTAQKQSPDMQDRYNGVGGLLAESIKRNAETAFSMSNNQKVNLVFDLIKAIRLQGYSGTAAASVRDEFIEGGEEKLLHHVDEALFNNGLEGPRGFVETLLKNSLPKKFKDAILDGKARWKKEGFPQLEDYKNNLIAFASTLDPRVIEIIGPWFLGIQSRHIDTKTNKEFIEILKQAAKGNNLDESINNINDIILAHNPLAPRSKLGKIIIPMWQANNRGDKLKILADNFDVITLSNNAAESLRNYLMKKLNDFKIDNSNPLIDVTPEFLKEKGYVSTHISKNEFTFLMLQAQMNITNGFRAISNIEYFRITDGIQLGIINKPDKKRTVKGKRVLKDPEVYKKELKAYYDSWKKVDDWNEAWEVALADIKKNPWKQIIVNKKKKMVKKDPLDVTISKLKPKNEHLGAHSETMGEAATGIVNNNLKTDADVKKINQHNISLYSALWILEKVDKYKPKFKITAPIDKGSKVNPLRELRINMYISDVEQKNHYHYTGVLAKEYIENKKAKEVLEEGFSRSQNEKIIITKTFNKSNAKRKGISIFDFDDTLAISDSKVLYEIPKHVRSGAHLYGVFMGKIPAKGKLTPAEFAEQSAELEKRGAIFDFVEFNKVIKGKKGPLADLALKRQGKYGSKDIFIVTARPQSAAYAIHAFLKGMGLEIPVENIIGLEDGRPEAKSNWVKEKIAEGYNDFYFADDSLPNVKAVQSILNDIDVKSDVQQAFSASNLNKLNKRFHEIIEEQSGVRKDIKYSQLVARREGAHKGKWEFYVPPSAEDFDGLLRYLAPRGEKGSQALDWFYEELIKPYQQAVNAINVAKTSIRSDYKKLAKAYQHVSKRLSKLIPNSKYTYDQAIRVYIWSKLGYEIPGISKRDVTSLLKVVNSSPDLTAYANNVNSIVSQNNKYAKPDEYWDVESILSDLDNVSNKAGRKVFLADWIAKINAVFTEDTLNKIEAVYGTRFREALEDSLYRMENGTNRSSGMNRYVNGWVNWVNNSVGTIMFFNRRSALLQTISTINFINWSDNNPLKAGMAFANAPQFWKDFAFLWNSPKLKQRRRGLQADLNWQEIANAAKRGKNKASAALSFLLKLGFTPTQLVDSFAIAAGGATFYRNRVNTYLKQGLSQIEAETKAWDEFSDIADKTQQSGDPSLISQEQASMLGRWILNFQNTPLQYNRIIKKSGNMLIKRHRYKGRTQFQSDMTNVSKIIYYAAIQNFIFSALQNALFALLPGFEGDEFDDLDKQGKFEEAKKLKILNSMIDMFLRGSGIRMAVVATIKNAILRYQKEEAKGYTADHTFTVIELLNISPSIGSKFRKMYGAHLTRTFSSDIIDERGFSIMADGRLNISPAYEMVGSALSAAFNIPMDRVVVELSALIEMTDSRNQTWQRVALGLGWRTWDVGAKNEEHDLIEIAGAERRKIEGIEKGKKTRAKNKEIQNEFFMNILPYLPENVQEEFWKLKKADRNKFIKNYKK